MTVLNKLSIYLSIHLSIYLYIYIIYTVYYIHITSNRPLLYAISGAGFVSGSAGNLTQTDVKMTRRCVAVSEVVSQNAMVYHLADKQSSD